jgi:Pyridoxamine 5'-phosphate oxidase
MTTWHDLEAADPALAAEARRLLERSGIGEGLLATVRDDASPRIHPVYVQIADGRLLTAVLARSAKRSDLAADGRYALHAHQDPVAPHELLIRGRAVEVTDPALRTAAVAAWPFSVGKDDALFELGIDHVLLGARADADAWPPIYRSWRAPRA